ncbi:MAG: hypothetical protein LWW83_15555 [Azonexaceae bacterium]|nr:hypothetical protein [Azonexaceae bacterium]
MRRTVPSILLAALIALNLPACSRQTAEEKGKEMATEKIDLIKGVGDAIKEKGGQAADSVAQGAGKVLQGADEGFGKAFEWQSSSSPSLDQAGLKVSRIDRATPGPDSEHSVNIYLVSNGPAAGKLTMIAYDSGKRELARTHADLKLASADGHYETLKLDERTPMKSIREVSFDFQPTASK